MSILGAEVLISRPAGQLPGGIINVEEQRGGGMECKIVEKLVRYADRVAEIALGMIAGGTAVFRACPFVTPFFPSAPLVCSPHVSGRRRCTAPALINVETQQGRDMKWKCIREALEREEILVWEYSIMAVVAWFMFLAYVVMSYAG